MKKLVGKKNASWSKWGFYGWKQTHMQGQGQGLGHDGKLAGAFGRGHAGGDWNGEVVGMGLNDGFSADGHSGPSSDGYGDSAPPVISSMFSINDSPPFTVATPLSFDPSAIAFPPPSGSSGSADSQSTHQRLTGVIAAFNKNAE